VPRIEHIAGWKVALFASAVFAMLFVVFGGFSTGYSLRSVGLLALAGALLGAIAAPDLEPKAFRFPKLWQMLFAILGSILIAFTLKVGPIGYAIAVLLGGVSGFFARYWTKYIDVAWPGS
jgi:hypothetical protein